ncbi:MAG: hypothetical protein Q4G09_02915 [Clostridia bacterium]|nr:hypothetical protein [Clostridia bacterium]
MWLWKKFWNTDIIGKIYILIILFIFVVATITVITRYSNKKEIEQKQNATNVEQLSYNVSIVETALIDNTVKENTVELETENNIKNTGIEAKENTKQQITTNSVKTESVNILQPKVETETSKSKQEVIAENKVTEAKSMNAEIEEQLPISVSTEEVEEYQVNNDMMEKMKNVINSNPSELMIQYGYNVEVDSSIISLTNQFTFTEQRVKNMLSYKFGTIRVYSQDYYVNGEYVWTECYLI